jgi:hypothetical protein
VRLAYALLALVALAGSVQAQAPHVAIVPVPGENVDAEVGRPILQAVQGALTTAAPSARFRIAGDESLVAAFAECGEPACRAGLVEQTGGYAVVLVRMTRPDPDGVVELSLEPVAVPSGESLGDPAAIQLPAATVTSPAAAQAVLGAILEPVASALPPPPPAAPATARVLVAVNADEAEVVVDGESVGQTPIAPIELSVGTHTLAIRGVGYETYSRSIEVPAEGLRVDVYLDPTADQAAQLATRDAEESDGYGQDEGEWYEQWWVWAAIGGGAVVLAAFITAVALAAGGSGGDQEGFPVPPIPTGDM